jgi:putative Holliday junction resolvase
MPKAASQTLLGIDFGLKRIGIAVGQTLTKSANPIAVLKAKNGEPSWNDIDALIQTWKADAIVVGIPYNMDGSEQPLTQVTRQFVKKLRAHITLPIYTIDERLTSVEAKQQLFDKGELKEIISTQQLDSYAAKLILEQWLQNQ